MVSREALIAVMQNARLDLGEEEIDRLLDDLEEILDSFEALDDVDTDGVEPAFHPIVYGGRRREDEEGDCLSQEEAFENAENTEDGYFKGPRSV